MGRIRARRVVRWALWIPWFAGVMGVASCPAPTEAGEYAAEFLEMGAGTRALAMGEAFVAVADDATAAYWNPAGLTDLAHRGQISLTHTEAFSGLARYDSIHLALKIQGSTALALSGLRYAVEKIPVYYPLQGSQLDRIHDPSLRSSGQPEKFTSDAEYAALLSFGRAFPFTFTFGMGLYPLQFPSELSIGVTYKVIFQRLSGFTGRGQDVDVGVLLRMHGASSEGHEPNRSFSIGVCARNLSQASITWDTPVQYKDSLRRSVRFGSAFVQYMPWIGAWVTITGDLNYGYIRSASYGGEVRIRQVIALRCGAGEGEWRAGAGLTLWRFHIDYAFVPQGLGDSHRISAALDF